MKTFSLVIASPGGSAYEGDAAQLSVMGSEGSLSVLAGHVPFACAVKEGPCRVYLPDGTVREGRTEEGFLTVGRDVTRLLVSKFTWNE